MSKTPDQISGLFAWWKADSLVLSDNDAVSSWSDSSGNGNDLTQINLGYQPVYKTSVVNSLPAVQFATDRVMKTGSITLEQPITAIGVVTQSSGEPNVLAFATIGGPNWQLFTQDGKWNLLTGVASTITSSTVESTTDFMILSAISNGATSELFVNGTSRVSGDAGTGGITATPLMIGGYEGFNFGLQGDIAELIFYSGALSTEDRAQVESYLSDKYLITISDHTIDTVTPIDGVIGFIGDSITMGFGVDPSVDAVAKMLLKLNTDKLDSFTYTADNTAVSGTSTVDWLVGSTNLTSSIGSFIGSGSGIVSVMLGTNDSRLGLSAVNFQTNMTNIIGGLLSVGVSKIILNRPPFMSSALGVVAGGYSDGPTADLLLQQYNDIFDILAGNNPTHVVVGDRQAYTYFQSHTNELADGLHPNETGYTSLGNFWASAFETIFSSRFSTAIPTIQQGVIKMTTLIRSLTNTSSTDALTLGIAGFDSTEILSIPASGTVDLLSIMTADSLHAMQAQLASIVSAGEATVADTIDSSVIYPAALINYIVALDTQVVFNPTTASATHTVGATVAVQIENATGSVDLFDNSTTVTVAAAGTGTITLNGHASPITVIVNQGVASILVTDSAADSVTLSITANSRSLTQSSTCAVTLS